MKTETETCFQTLENIILSKNNCVKVFIYNYYGLLLYVYNFLLILMGHHIAVSIWILLLF